MIRFLTQSRTRSVALALCALAILAALVSLSTRSTEAVTPSEVWTERISALGAQTGTSGAERAAQLGRALEAGLIFPDIATELAEIAGDITGNGAEGTPSRPAVPKVLSASVIDGVAGVQLLDSESRVITVSVGESTPSGWELLATDLNQAEFGWEDVRETLDIAPPIPLGAQPNGSVPQRTPRPVPGRPQVQPIRNGNADRR